MDNKELIKYYVDELHEDIKAATERNVTKAEMAGYVSAWLNAVSIIKIALEE